MITLGVIVHSISIMLCALHDVLDVMLTRFREHHMQVNRDKFKMMVFGQCKNVTHSIMVNDAVMTSVEEARILRVLLNTGLFLRNHISLSCQKSGTCTCIKIILMLRQDLANN